MAPEQHANGLNGLNQTGQPDTPVEVITALLKKAVQQDDVAAMRAQVQQALDIVGGLDEYLEEITTPAPQVVQDLITASLNHDWDSAYKAGKTQFAQKKECCAGALEGRLMKALVAITRAKNVLEVGMFTGTTTLAMAEALPEDGKVVALEIEPYMAAFAQPHFTKAGLSDRIHVMLGPALESMGKLAEAGRSFDLAFLDADKPGYIHYYNALMDKGLLAPGGCIVVDNSLMKGRTYAPLEQPDELADAMRDFNAKVVKDPRVEVVALPFRDGVSLVYRRPAPVADAVMSGLHSNSIMQRFKLNGKVALITGAGQGIGRAFAHALGEAGASVAVVDLDSSKAQAVAEELKTKGIRSIAIQADVTSAKDCDSMVASTVQQLGGLHIGINNAGINKNAAAEDTTTEDWDATFSVNTKGVFMCCRAQGRHMLQQGGGTIINTASMATLLVPHPQKQAAYNASKAAVVKLTQSLAAEWADRGVRVNCMSPGIVNTPLIQESEALRPLVGEWLQQIPIGRLAEVTDLQAAVVFMACEASSYMTGHNLVIEGGQSLW